MGSKYSPPRKKYQTPKKSAVELGPAFLYRRLATVVLITGVVLLILYFWIMTVVANIDSFWGLFPSGETATEEKDSQTPRSPFLNNPPKFTKEDNITVSGFAEEGATVKIYVNDTEVGKTLADKEGSFRFENIKLQEGSNEVFTIATNQDNVNSPPSAVYSIQYLNKPPKLEVTGPTQGQTISQEQNGYPVKGVTDIGDTVTVNGHRAIVDPEGNFTYVNYLQEGKNEILVIAKDLAGNESIVGIDVTYVHP